VSDVLSPPVVRAVLWLHPVLGLVTVALALRTASLALRGRAPGRSAAALRARHRRLGPWVLGLVAVNWLAGLGSVWLDPRAPNLAVSGHFRVGSALVVLFTLAALVSRRIDHDPRARAVHPWIGATALLLAGVQVFLGLQLMPL
jgi:Protein of unknown function (DUF4079)